MVTCLERAYLFALLRVIFKCVFVTFPCGVLRQVWNLIVWISDLCHLTYFVSKQPMFLIKEALPLIIFSLNLNSLFFLTELLLFAMFDM